MAKVSVQVTQEEEEEEEEEKEGVVGATIGDARLPSRARIIYSALEYSITANRVLETSSLAHAMCDLDETFRGY